MSTFSKQTGLLIALIISFLVIKNCHAQENDTNEKSIYDYDTLLIKEYTSENGHKIRLEGSRSKDLYRISVESKNGVKKTFNIAESWYIASHSSILWDNEDYIFVNSGCGTVCWIAQVLPLNNNRESLYYHEYIYEDSSKNLIVYPDTVNNEHLIIENFDTQQQIKAKLNICEQTILPILLVDTIYMKNENELLIKYYGDDCQQIQEKSILLESLNGTYLSKSRFYSV